MFDQKRFLGRQILQTGPCWELRASFRSSMARFVARSAPLASRPSLPITRPQISAALRWRSQRSTVIAFSLPPSSLFPPLLGVSQWRDIHSRTRYSPSRIPFPGFFVSARAFRKQGQRRAAKKQKSKKQLLELDVKICIEEELPDDPEILVFIRSYGYRLWFRFSIWKVIVFF